MANDERDRLGDKLKDVERAREDRYFAEQDKKLLEKMRKAGAEGETVASLRCPKCSNQLTQITIEGVEVDTCPGCNGLWLDAGELSKIARREESGWLARWLRTP